MSGETGCLICDLQAKAREPLVIVRCSCGRAYTETTWNALHLVGHCDAETGERSGARPGALELRNCSRCDSTITRLL